MVGLITTIILFTKSGWNAVARSFSKDTRHLRRRGGSGSRPGRLGIRWVWAEKAKVVRTPCNDEMYRWTPQQVVNTQKKI